MASSSCSLVSIHPPSTPAKIPTSTILILRNAGLILNPPPPPPSFSTLSSKPISVKPFLSALRASHSQKYVYHDPIPKFAEAIFNDFLHNEYGGPGTLLVEPFTDMFVALKEKKLPGAPVAARASLLWAQNHLDHDWEVWNSNSPK
uniref:Uncharacterized protein n=1 Tax=Gossypium raimondii TaxID=29730 RepID=A0A0D2TWS0_GOSRA|nr:hypothetical protein B456_009G344500 [Gossypium raimondii]